MRGQRIIIRLVTWQNFRAAEKESRGRKSGAVAAIKSPLSFLTDIRPIDNGNHSAAIQDSDENNRKTNPCSDMSKLWINNWSEF